MTIDSEDYETGHTKCNVINRYNGEIDELPCHRNLPFVCMVKAKNAPYDELCDVNSQGTKNYQNFVSPSKSFPANFDKMNR